MELHELSFSGESPPTLAPDEAGATVWHGAGGPLVVAKREGEWCWVRLTGVASYRFPATSPDLAVACVAVPAPGAAVDLVVDSYFRLVAPLALHVYGLESLHGTALGFDGAAILLCATSTTGKSTLAHVLTERGAALLGDDGLVVEVGSGAAAGVLLHPLPFTLQLRQEAAAHFRRPVTARGVDLAKGATVTPQAVPVRAVVCLERVTVGPPGGVEPTADELAPRAAFTRLLGNAYAFSLDDEGRKRRMLAAYLRFASAVPVYLLRYSSGLERLASVAALVEKIAAGVEGPSRH